MPCRLALNQNPQVILANIEVSQSEQERLLARSALLPQVAGNVSEKVHRVNLEAAIGFSFPGFAQHVGPYRGVPGRRRLQRAGLRPDAVAAVPRGAVRHRRQPRAGD